MVQVRYRGEKFLVLSSFTNGSGYECYHLLAVEHADEPGPAAYSRTALASECY